MIYVAEVLAIYELPGVVPNGARVSARDADFTQAQTASGNVGHYTVAGQEAPEYLLRFGRTGDDEQVSRYGFGWRARQYINVRQDADNIGRAIWTQLAARGLRDGSKVEVFEHLADQGDPFATGDLLFRRALPSGSDVG